MIDGIEVHQATREFTANGATYQGRRLGGADGSAVRGAGEGAVRRAEVSADSASAGRSAADGGGRTAARAAEVVGRPERRPRQHRRLHRLRQRRLPRQQRGGGRGAGGGGGGGGRRSRRGGRQRPRAASRRRRSCPTTSPAGRCRCRWASKWSRWREPVSDETRAHAAQDRPRRADRGKSGRLRARCSRSRTIRNAALQAR